MKDNELQELFAAKRTTEANRRRQEQLAKMIEGRSLKARPLWPVWVASIAAGFAVLLMTVPALFQSEAEEAPVLVAQTETIKADDSGVIGITSIPSETSITSTPRTTTHTRDIIEEAPEPAVEEPVTIEDLPEPVVKPEPIQEPQMPPQRRVHRRTSTHMVTSDKTAPAPRFDYRKAVADVLCQEESQPITLHTIKIS